MARFSLSPPASSSVRTTTQPLQQQQQQQQYQQQQQSSPLKSSAAAAPQWKWTYPPQDQYYHRPPASVVSTTHQRDDGNNNFRDAYVDDDDDDGDGSSSSSSEESDDSYEEQQSATFDDPDDDEEEEEEPPHPLGFAPRYGRTRFGLSPKSTHESFDSHSRRVRYQREVFDTENEYAWNALVGIDKVKQDGSDNNSYNDGSSGQQFPPIGSSYHLRRAEGVSTSKLLRGAQSHRGQQHYDDGGTNNNESDSMQEILCGMDRIANLVNAASCVTDGSQQHIQQQQQQQLGVFTTPVSSYSQQQQIMLSPHMQPRSTSKLLRLAQACEQHQSTLPTSMSRLEKQRQQSYQQSCQGFLLLLQADASRVSSAESRILQRQEDIAKLEEQERLEALAEQDRLQKEREAAEKAERERVAAAAARTESERLKQEQKLQQLAQAEKEAEEEAAKKNAHISRAQSLIRNLDTVREGLQEFDKAKSVGRRRLQFKKIVNGKINTLSHDEHKVGEVGRMVCDAITNAANDDNAAAGGEPVLGMGKKYLLDLLCANLIVRVQADGFTGTRGDGFPLAGMFAFVSTQCEEIGPVLEGHLYGVCPMAIPALSLDSKHDGGGGSSGDENDLMESLGMIKDVNGEFESFDKFLHRTEGLISIMADIMSSLPSNHTLLGGHRGALTWLQRFIDLMPPPPTAPLPLLTAPALVAFLTGAGHMLANKFPTEFKPLLDTINKDILSRLDESEAGIPSATRLKKVLEDVGFEGMKKELPKGAVGGLYDGKEGSGGGIQASSASTSSSSSSGFGQSQTQAPATSAFGQTSSGAGDNNPFSSSNWGASSSSGGDSAFGVSSTASTAPMDNTTSAPMATSTMGASPFGAGQSSGFGSTPAAPSPFGGAGQSVGFGSTPAPAPAAGGFGTSTGATAGFAPAAAFGGGSSGFSSAPAAAAPSPFGGSAGFGAAAPSAFGSAAPAPSPFGTATAPSAFGAAPAASQPSPFGMSAAPAPAGGFGASPFGSAAPAPGGGFGSSPFGGGAPAPSPFGGGGQQGSGTFGGGGGGSNKQPCKFFASGKCNFGDRCRFSHDIGPGGGGNVNPSPFGGGGQQGSGAFGGGGNGGGGAKKPPCKFFASGNCRHGASCKFSHDQPGSGGGGGGGFGGSNPSPFGGGNSGGGSFGGGGFGSSGASTGFGSSPSPFGGPRR